MNQYLAMAPLQYRCFFYALPLFLQWIIGITWDKDEQAIAISRRSMTLSVFYIVLIATIFSMQELMFFLLPDQEYVIRWVSLIGHSFFTLSYLILSLTMAISALLNRFNAASFLDAAAMRLERLINF